MALAARRFFLGDTEEGLYPLDMAELQNTSQPWNDPSDRERLKFVYQPNVQYDLQGRSYVPQMGSPNVERTNINLYGPRVDPTFPGDMSSSGNCPYGFYWYNGTCIPGTTLDPTSPNFLGGRVGQGPAKGVLMIVQPPRVTYTNQPFQIAAQVQNVGGKPAKYALKTSIPALNIGDAMSGSAYLNPGQSGWIYQTISFSNIPSGSLQQVVIQAKVDLVKMEQATTGAEITYVLEDTNTVTIPSPRLSTLPVGPPQGLPIDNYSRFPGGPLPHPFPGRPPVMMPPPRPYYPQPRPNYPTKEEIYIHPQRSIYTPGERIQVYAVGFKPYENTIVKYNYKRSSGGIQVGSISIGGGSTRKSEQKSERADGYGRVTTSITVPSSTDGVVGIGVTGLKSNGAAVTTIRVPASSSSGGGISIGGGMFGGLFG